MNTSIKILLWWLVILVCAVANGVLRERVLIPQLGPTAGLMSSGVLLCAIVFLIALIAAASLHTKGVNYWSVGATWLILTLIFEFTFGLGVQHKSLAEVLHAYTFEGGNLWPAVLVMVLVSPPLAARLCGPK